MVPVKIIQGLILHFVKCQVELIPINNRESCEFNKCLIDCVLLKNLLIVLIEFLEFFKEFLFFYKIIFFLDF